MCMGLISHLERPFFIQIFCVDKVVQLLRLFTQFSILANMMQTREPKESLMKST